MNIEMYCNLYRILSNILKNFHTKYNFYYKEKNKLYVIIIN